MWDWQGSRAETSHNEMQTEARKGATSSFQYKMPRMLTAHLRALPHCLSPLGPGVWRQHIAMSAWFLKGASPASKCALPGTPLTDTKRGGRGTCAPRSIAASPIWRALRGVKHELVTGNSGLLQGHRVCMKYMLLHLQTIPAVTSLGTQVPACRSPGSNRWSRNWARGSRRWRHREWVAHCHTYQHRRAVGGEAAMLVQVPVNAFKGI